MLKRGSQRAFIAAIMVAAGICVAHAADPNWKRGRIYYRMICTTCHVAQTGQAISPSEKTIAEWQVYIKADQHAAAGSANSSVRYYVSREYRESVKDTNRAAEKFLRVPEEELMTDLGAFLVHGAKDSDTPARCR